MKKDNFSWRASLTCKILNVLCDVGIPYFALKRYIFPFLKFSLLINVMATHKIYKIMMLKIMFTLLGIFLKWWGKKNESVYPRMEMQVLLVRSGAFLPSSIPLKQRYLSLWEHTQNWVGGCDGLLASSLWGCWKEINYSFEPKKKKKLGGEGRTQWWRNFSDSVIECMSQNWQVGTAAGLGDNS